MPISTSNGLTSPNCRPFSFLEGSEKQVPETVQDITDAVRGCAGLLALLQPAHIGEHLYIRTRVALKDNGLLMYLEADGSHGDSSRQWRTRDRIGEPSRLMTCSPGFLPADDAQPLVTVRVARKEREKIIASIPFKKEGGEQEAHAQQDIKPTIALAKNLGTPGTSSQFSSTLSFS